MRGRTEEDEQNHTQLKYEEDAHLVEEDMLKLEEEEDLCLKSEDKACLVEEEILKNEQ